jgi:hypothetical protein
MLASSVSLAHKNVLLSMTLKEHPSSNLTHISLTILKTWHSQIFLVNSRCTSSTCKPRWTRLRLLTELKIG